MMDPTSSPAAQPSAETAPPRTGLWRGRLLRAAPLAVLIFAIAFMNFRYIVQDRADFAVVDADHFMLRAKLIHDALEDGFDFGDFIPGTKSAYDVFYSPLNWDAGALLMQALEPSALVLRLYNSCYLPLALIYVFFLARLFVGPWAALLAVFLGGTNSLVLETSRYFTQDAPLMLPVAGALYHAARSEGLTRFRTTMIALAWALFGAAMKPQIGAILFLPMAVHLMAGSAARARLGWPKLALTIGWQAGLAGGTLLLAWLAMPKVFSLLPNAAEILKADKFAFEIIVPENETGPGLFPAFCSWFVALIWAARRLAWPLAALFLAGSILAPLRLAGRKRATAFLSIPLSFISYNALLNWSGVDLEAERYLGPLFVLYGIPVVAVFGLIGRRAWRRTLLGALGVYCLIGWAGPRLLPRAFDCQPFTPFNSIRYNGLSREEFPLFFLKSWDEPVIEPTANSSAERILASLGAREPAGKPARVACVTSHIPGDDTIWEYEWLRTEGCEFFLAENPGDLLRADYALAVVPASPGAGQSPRNLLIEMRGAHYRAIVMALENETLRARLGFEELDEIGLPAGRVLRICRRAKPMDEGLAMASAVVWHEMLNLPKYTIPVTLEIADWLDEAGYEKAARDFRKLTLVGSSALQASADWAGDFRRLAKLEDEIEKMRRGYGSLNDLNTAVSTGIEAGPGMVLTCAAAALQRGGKEAAEPYIQLNQMRFPQHVETWKAAQVYGVGDDRAQLAALGEALAQDCFNESQVVTRATEAAYAMWKLEMPQFWNARIEGASLLERDQPDALWTLFLRAAIKNSLGEWDDGQAEILRQAIGKAGAPFAESIDYHLYHLLGVCLLRQGKVDEGMSMLRKGGWPGVEELLAWRRAEGNSQELHNLLKWAARPQFALSPRGSDAVRTEIACGLAQSDPAEAYRAFSEMNDTPAAKDFALFSQLMSAADKRNAARFAAALEKEKMGFYSPARAIFYLAVASEFENPGAAIPEMQLARMLPEQRAMLSLIRAGRKESTKANAVFSKTPGLSIPAVEPFRWEPADANLEIAWNAAPVPIVYWRYESGTLREIYCKFRILTSDGIGADLKLLVEELRTDGRWAAMGETPLLAGADYPFDVEMPLTATGQGATFRASISFGRDNPYAELAGPEKADPSNGIAAQVQIRRVAISPIEAFQP